MKKIAPFCFRTYRATARPVALGLYWFGQKELTVLFLGQLSYNAL